jgi:hypothetical protein
VEDEEQQVWHRLVLNVVKKEVEHYQHQTVEEEGEEL